MAVQASLTQMFPDDLVDEDLVMGCLALFGEKECFRKSSFWDDVWILHDGHTSVIINYQGIRYAPEDYTVNQFKLILKCYCVLLCTNYQILTVRSMINPIMKISQETVGFRLNYPEAISANRKRILIDFLERIHQDTWSWKTITEIYTGKRSNRRALNRVFADYYTLYNEVEKFWAENKECEADDEATKDEKKRNRIIYGPVYFYLRLSVLPMRPQGFCRSPREMVRRNEDGDYYLLLASSNIKGTGKKVTNTPKDYPVFLRRTINGLAEELIQYQSMMEEYAAEYKDCKGECKCSECTKSKHCEYYRDVEDCKAYFFDNYLYSKVTHNDQINMVFTENHLQKRLDRFIKKELVEKRGYTCLPQTNGDCKVDLSTKTIGRVHVGDMRHLAIISMIYLDIDPSVIMELAGHESIETTCHYYNVSNITNGYLFFLTQSEKIKTPLKLVVHQNVGKNILSGRKMFGYTCFCPENSMAAHCYMHHMDCSRCEHSRIYERTKNEAWQENICGLDKAMKRFVHFFNTKHEAEIKKAISEIQDRLSKPEIRYRSICTVI